MEQILILLAVGAVGGVVRAFLGYETQSDPGETFNYAKAGRSVVRAAVLGTIAAMGIVQVTSTEITIATYFSTFLVAIGTDVLTKEGIATVRGKTVK